MRFTIITPTILRPTLQRTCESIESQSHKDWQHIVVVDRVGTIPTQLLHPQRLWMWCNPTHEGWYGAPCRESAFPYITGDYVLYLDDDDFAINDCMAVLAGVIKEEEWGIFNCLLHGNEFLNPLPGHCSTTSQQIYHKPRVKGVEMRWPVPDRAWGGMDGVLVERLKDLTAPVIHHTVPLANNPQIGGGKL